jgi:hydrogenase maturation protein HypF
VRESVARGAPALFVMLPYSPLHHLLLAEVGETLVMTSANVSDEPIAFVDEDALERLGGIADLFLVHDRPIQTRTDDSVVRVVGSRKAATAEKLPILTFMRRSRGYVPSPISLPGAGTPRPLLACGAELKNTFCLARGTRAWVSHHVGDLENYETLRSFTEGIEHFGALFAVRPEVVVHDLHPEYLSTKYALERDGVELIGVQHHHAHLAACLAEHGEPGPAIGAIFDGTGYGLDGTVWGGELLLGGARSFRRVGSLVPVSLPGGARAIKQPWRMACSWLSIAFDDGAPDLPASLAGRVDPRAWAQVHRMAATGTAAPATTSMGRLFDAVAALCGIRTEVNYEGQAAIELEAACDPGERGSYPIALSGAPLAIDPRETIRAVAADVRAGTAPGAIARRFHRTIARATVDACVTLAGVHATEVVVLSGGVFQSRLLLESVSTAVSATGLRVLVPERLPVNDGAISYGQAAVAAAHLT